MATSGQVANDLRLQAAAWRGRRDQGTPLTDICAKLIRAADAIDNLLEQIEELSAQAETQAERYERHFYGDDLHGA